MNAGLEKLYRIGKKNSRYIIGLMSGTSLDGLDIALCEIEQNGLATKISLLNFCTVNYDDTYKKEVRKICSKKTILLEDLCLLNEWIGIKHATIVNACLKRWNFPNVEIDLIASHGQTVYHAPKSLHQRQDFYNGTLQIGDADHIAVHTGIITVSDFRQKHIAAGGEGAPLAAYGDFLLYSENDHDVILLNIGGIANFTYLPAGGEFDNIACSDTGPGNILMDAYVQQNYPGKYFDNDSMIAREGTTNEVLLGALMNNDFFQLSFSKTTGPELFNLSYLENAISVSNTNSLSKADIMATLNKFTARTIGDAIKKITMAHKNIKLFISGGGIHNPLLIDNIKKELPGISIDSTMKKNIDPDAKEAVLFALLANECVAGNGSNFGNGTAHFPAITMGKISFPG